MIKEFVNAFEQHRDAIRLDLSKSGPISYEDLVSTVIKHLSDTEHEGSNLDPKRIVLIDHGDYQGTLVFVIGAKGYQPHRYWYLRIAYGSCSVCDTLQSCENMDDYMTLALHIVQGLKSMNDGLVED